jgi:hypothetical protein
MALQQGAADWTVVVSAIASVMSAVVALAATILAARTYKQSQQDKKDELEYKRPKLRFIGESIQLVTSVGDDYGIAPFFHFSLMFQNKQTHPATNIRIEGLIFREDGVKVAKFVKEPIEDLEANEVLDVTHDIPKSDLQDKEHYLRLRVTYHDGRTQKEYSQLIYRRFYGVDEYSDTVMIELLELDKTDWESYVKTHQNVVDALSIEARQAGEKMLKAFKDQ